MGAEGEEVREVAAAESAGEGLAETPVDGGEAIQVIQENPFDRALDHIYARQAGLNARVAALPVDDTTRKALIDASRIGHDAVTDKPNAPGDHVYVSSAVVRPDKANFAAYIRTTLDNDGRTTAQEAGLLQIGTAANRSGGDVRKVVAKLPSVEENFPLGAIRETVLDTKTPAEEFARSKDFAVPEEKGLRRVALDDAEAVTVFSSAFATSAENAEAVVAAAETRYSFAGQALNNVADIMAAPPTPAAPPVAPLPPPGP